MVLKTNNVLFFIKAHMKPPALLVIQHLGICLGVKARARAALEGPYMIGWLRAPQNLNQALCLNLALITPRADQTNHRPIRRLLEAS